MSKKERIAWMQQAREQLLRKLEPVRPWNIDAEGPYGDLVRDNAELALRSRLQWLDRVEKRLGKTRR